MGVAKKMKHIFGDAIDLSILTNESPAAAEFKIKGAVKVIVNGEIVPLKIAISDQKNGSLSQGEISTHFGKIEPPAFTSQLYIPKHIRRVFMKTYSKITSVMVNIIMINPSSRIITLR